MARRNIFGRHAHGDTNSIRRTELTLLRIREAYWTLGRLKQLRRIPNKRITRRRKCIPQTSGTMKISKAKRRVIKYWTEREFGRIKEGQCPYRLFPSYSGQSSVNGVLPRLGLGHRNFRLYFIGRGMHLFRLIIKSLTNKLWLYEPSFPITNKMWLYKH